MKKFAVMTLFMMFFMNLNFVSALSPVTENHCSNFTQEEMKKVQILTFLFQQKGESFDTRVSDDENSDEYKEAVKYRQDLISKLQKTKNCIGGFENYDDLKKGLAIYIVRLNKLAGNTPNQFKSKYPEADKIMEDAQKKLFFYGIEKMDILKNIFQEKSTINLSGWFKETSENKPSKLNLLVNTDGFFDIKNNKVDLKFSLSGGADIRKKVYNWKTEDTNVDSYFKNEKIAGDIVASLKLSKDNLYFMFSQFDFDLSGNDTKTDDSNKFKSYVKLLKNKRIKIDLNKKPQNSDSLNYHNNPLSYNVGFAFGKNMNLFNNTFVYQKLISKSFLQFLHKKGNTYYAVPSVNICEVVSSQSLQNKDIMLKHCKNTIKEMQKETNNKGFITLKVSGNDYELGLTDEFMKSEVKKDFQKIKFLTKNPLITRNNDGMKTITVLFDESERNGLFVKDNKINLVYSDEREFSPNIDFNGKYDKDGFDIGGMINFDDTKVVVNTDYEEKERNSKVNAKIEVLKDEEKLGYFEYFVSKNISTPKNHKFIYPKDDEVITLKEVEQMIKKEENKNPQKKN